MIRQPWPQKIAGMIAPSGSLYYIVYA